MQNSPEIVSAIIRDGNLDIQYSVPSSAAHSAFPITVEFFLNGGAKGQSFLGLHNYTTADSTPTASVPSRKAVGASLIVATATDANGNTSEFSAVATVFETLLTVAGQREVGNQAIGQNDLSYDAHDELMYGSLTAGELSTPLAETLADQIFEDY